MHWSAKIKFKSAVVHQITRQLLDDSGVAVGDPIATPHCPERFLTLLQLVDDNGCVFQIGTDAIDLAAKLPPNTGCGVRVLPLGEFFKQGGACSYTEDTLSDRLYESDPFEIEGNFNPWDLCFQYWTVPSETGEMRMFIDCDRIEYRRQVLKMNVLQQGYKATPTKSWGSKTK